jgi:exodeoxyribonuclease V
MPLEPTDEQAEAIEAIQAWHEANSGVRAYNHTIKTWQKGAEFLLDGGAGVGKSTVAGMAVRALNLRRVVFGAYTAKAARVMQSKGMEGAQTLHSLLYRPELDKDGRIVGWRKNDRSPCKDAELIVVDEVSMCPESVAEELRSYEKPILALGDIDGQLPPPESAGAFQRRRPDFRLHELHRAAAESPITRLAWAVRRGSPLTPSNIPEARVAPLDAAAWPYILNRDNQVLCGKHRTRETVIRRHREQFGFRGLPQPGEPLVCTRNNYRQGLINGDIAVMWRITEDDPDANFYKATLMIEGEERPDIKIIRPQQQDQEQFYQTGSADFDFAYALTVHKSQGSEYPSVVLIDDRFAQWDRDLRRRWLYTGLTRASECVQVFTTG